MGKLVPIVDSLKKDIKDFIRSIVKGSEQILQKRMDERFEVLEVAVTNHSKDIKEVKATLAEHGKTLAEHGKKLDTLQETVDGHTAKLVEHDTRLDSIDSKLAEHDTRFDRIDSKLDRQNGRLDDHEARITALETPHL